MENQIPSKIIKEAKKDKEWAIKVLNDPVWMSKASTWSKETAREWAKMSVIEMAKIHWEHLKERATISKGHEVYFPD